MTRPTRAQSLRLALLACGVACVCVAPVGAQRSTRAGESAPVEVMAPARASAAPTLALSEEVTFVLRDADGEPYYTVIPPALVRRSGARWLAFAGYEIHEFDSAGRWMSSVGRLGSGPGDYRAVYGGCPLQSDSVFVYDRNLRRFSVLTPSLAHHRVVDADRERWIAGLGCLPGGRIVVAYGSIAPSRRFELDLVLIDLATSARTALGQYDGGPATAVARPTASVFSIGSRIYVAPAVNNEIIELDVSGAALRVLRTQDVLVETEARILEEQMARTVPRNVSDATRAAQLARMRSFGFPSHWPAYGRVLPGDNGDIWVEHYRMPFDSTASWSRFNSEWKQVDRLTFEVVTARLRRQVLAFSGAHVMLFEFTPDGDLQVVQRRLMRR